MEELRVNEKNDTLNKNIICCPHCKTEIKLTVEIGGLKTFLEVTATAEEKGERRVGRRNPLFCWVGLVLIFKKLKATGNKRQSQTTNRGVVLGQLQRGTEMDRAER